MFEKEIDRLINKSRGQHYSLFESYNVRSLKNVIEKELLKKNRLYICFPEKLEEVFQKYYFAKSIFRIRIMLVFGIIIYLLFGIADFILFPHIHRTISNRSETQFCSLKLTQFKELFKTGRRPITFFVKIFPP